MSLINFTMTYTYLHTATTEELYVPILRSENIKFSNPVNKPLHLIIPTGRSNVQKDCICPLVYFMDQQCSNLSVCRCISNTTFTPSMIEICRTGPLEITIVFMNLSPSTNNTRIFFYAYDMCCEEKDQIECGEYYWEYVKSYEIIQGTYMHIINELYAVIIVILTCSFTRTTTHYCS